MGLLHGSLTPPSLAARPLNAAMMRLLSPDGARPVDFSIPPGAPALAPPDSVSWRIFKNPVSLFIGGVAAVILELGEPRVRSGVWDHSSFRSKPAHRLARTGLAAMVTVYGPRQSAEAMIAGVRRMHDRVTGTTPDGVPYRANDPELLDWVQATAGFGFMEAYHAFVRPLSQADRDRAYAEAQPAASLYGATGAPRSDAEMAEMFARFAPRLERSEIVFEFLDLMRTAPVLPGAMRPLQRILVRAAVEMTPDWARRTLDLGPDRGLRAGEAGLVRALGKQSDRVVLTAHPAVQACRRMGLPDDYLYR